MHYYNWRIVYQVYKRVRDAICIVKCNFWMLDWTVKLLKHFLFMMNMKSGGVVIWSDLLSCSQVEVLSCVILFTEPSDFLPLCAIPCVSSYNFCLSLYAALLQSVHVQYATHEKSEYKKKFVFWLWKIPYLGLGWGDLHFRKQLKYKNVLW